MPKATITDISQAGFSADQFGTPADFLTASTGYVALILAAGGRWAADKIGSVVYAALAADTVANDYVIEAEKMYAVSKLWGRRAAFKDAALVVGLQEGAYLERREFLAHAASAWAAALQAIADAQSALGLDVEIPGSGLSVACVEHGHFESVAA